MKLRDAIISLFLSAFTNSYILFLSAKHKTPIYIDHDEVIWTKTATFCGGEFAFYEQKWGLIVPVLCLIYPLRAIIDSYYIPIIRPFIVFLVCFLLLKMLRKLFKDEKTILLVTLLHFSYFIGVPGSPYHIFSLIRISSPSYFLLFFLVFYISFLNFLDSRTKRNKIIAGLTLGITFYSSSHWYLYATASIVLMTLYFAISKKKEELKDCIQIVLIGIAFGMPALIFNYFQFQILGESVRRGGYFITGVHKIMVSNHQEMYIMLGFFTLSTVSFLLARNFSPKSIFCLLSSFSGIVLVLAELVSGVFVLTLNHVVYQFNLFNRINLGFVFEKISSKKKISIFLFSLTMIIFITVWITFFRFFFQITNEEPDIPKWAYELIKIDISRQKKLEKISEWLKQNTEKNSVIIFEGKGSFIKYTEMFDELKISLMSERYAFHSIINFFSELSDHEVFERFILREKLIGKTVDDLKAPNKIPAGFSAFGGFWEVQKQTGRAFFGLPQNFEIEKHPTNSIAIQEFIKETIRLFSDEKYIIGLMDKYKIDYIIRLKPKKENEIYLETLTKIEDYYVFKLKKEHIKNGFSKDNQH